MPHLPIVRQPRKRGSYFLCQLEQLEAADSTAAPGLGGKSVASSPVRPFALATLRYFSVVAAMASRSSSVRGSGMKLNWFEFLLPREF